MLSRAAILCDGEMIRSHDLDMLGLDRDGRPRQRGDDADDRVELPPIDLDRLGDGESLKDITERTLRAVERAAIAAALRRDRNSGGGRQAARHQPREHLHQDEDLRPRPTASREYDDA